MKTKDSLVNILAVVGVAMIGGGLWLVSPAVAVVAVGVIFLCLAVIGGCR